VILGTQDEGIQRVAYSSYGAPKPYFTLEGGRLIAHNQPVPKFTPDGSDRSLLVRALSYSYVAAQIMGKIDRDYWLTGDGQQFKRVGVDDVDVSCALLERLKRSNDALTIRSVILLQYAWAAVRVRGGPKPPFADMVAQCAQEIGLEVVDTFAPLRQIAERDAKELESFYVKHEGNFGHMSAQGNRFVAQLLADQLRAEPPSRVAAVRLPSTEQKGDGINRVVAPEELERTVPRGQIAELSVNDGWRSWFGFPQAGPKRYQLKATGSEGEHYIQVPLQDLPAGTYALSLRARPITTARIRLQLLDREINGAFVDFDLEANTAGIQRLGRARGIKAPVQSLADGWRNLTVVAGLPEKGARVFVQLLDDKGASSFQANGDAIEVSAIQVEAMQTTSSDHAIATP
jgi:hypothetical protein